VFPTNTNVRADPKAATMSAQELFDHPASDFIDAEHQDCRAVTDLLDRSRNKWTVMTVGALAQGPMRFNALQRAINGISHRMLTLTLKALVRDGLVTRHAYPTMPPQVEYELTQRGRSLLEPLSGLFDWAVENRDGVEKSRRAFDSLQHESRRD
jgi:DNA-binding HxlR family transcriptional regulator